MPDLGPTTKLGLVVRVILRRPWIGSAATRSACILRIGDILHGVCRKFRLPGRISHLLCLRRQRLLQGFEVFCTLQISRLELSVRSLAHGIADGLVCFGSIRKLLETVLQRICGLLRRSGIVGRLTFARTLRRLPGGSIAGSGPAGCTGRTVRAA